MVTTFVVECLDFFRSQVDENHIAPSLKDRWLVFRQDGFRKLYPMFAVKKMQFYPVLSIVLPHRAQHQYKIRFDCHCHHSLSLVEIRLVQPVEIPLPIGAKEKRIAVPIERVGVMGDRQDANLYRIESLCVSESQIIMPPFNRQIRKRRLHGIS